MTRSKTHKSDEDLLGTIRNQKAEIKRLKRKIKELEKDVLLKEDNKEDEQDEEQICDNCGKGILTIIDIGIRRYSVCGLCKTRERLD